MADETENVVTNTVKTASDGTVKIAVEKYNELLEEIARQKGANSGLREQITRLRNEPPVINRTIVEKTAEMAAHDHRMWGGSLMALGACSFVVGAIRFKLAGNTGS